jgi:hypothetical protein
MLTCSLATTVLDVTGITLHGCASRDPAYIVQALLQVSHRILQSEFSQCCRTAMAECNGAKVEPIKSEPSEGSHDHCDFSLSLGALHFLPNPLRT